MNPPNNKDVPPAPTVQAFGMIAVVFFSLADWFSVSALFWLGCYFAGLAVFRAVQDLQSCDCQD